MNATNAENPVVSELTKPKRPHLRVVPGYPGIYIYPNQPDVFFIRPKHQGRQVRYRLKARTLSCAAREQSQFLARLADFRAGLGVNPFAEGLGAHRLQRPG
jgi:hypothetical protein